MSFQIGQRWISDSESEQGLGTVTSVVNRFVTIVFTATGDSRQYAQAEAPLTRVIFNKDDIIPSHEGWHLRVERIEENSGVLTYHGHRTDNNEPTSLKEIMIDHFIKFNKPHDRLLNGQIDRQDWFKLRKDCLAHQFTQQQSELSGLTGARVSLIPHQLYIAEEVGKRFAPRVLLADEVGLGKTIEAGLIIHQQLVSGRAKRVLIIVPEPLMHQWLVEMLRRFNLPFSIFDDERCVEAGDSNPFSTEQLVLVNLDFVCKNPQWYENILAEEWDLMVVDEAHHLGWHPEEPSVEFQCIEQLARHIPGVLLLTATPDQLGHESHFARLSLLDPDRFYSYEKFVEEEQNYEAVAQAANNLVEGENLSATDIATLTELLKESDISAEIEHCNGNNSELRQNTRSQLLHQLLDRHGTGRILFRNSRNTIKGFPGRQLLATPLTMPDEYEDALLDFIQSGDNSELLAAKQCKYIFTPEMMYGLDHHEQTWHSIDPRIDYLIDTLKAHKGEKVLVICAHAQTAIDIETALRTREGIRAAIFHEGLSIIERDRAAAYFAQSEDAAQVLLCSEIGSEGRNFQFAHHLVLFDLPSNPDLLEQRIGRLDRIGQTDVVKIHVPYFQSSAQSLLFDWYKDGLNAFESTCVTGRAIYEEFGAQLIDIVLSAQWMSDDAQQFIIDSHKKHLTIKADLESGRDKLLELHSSGQGKAQKLVADIAKQDNDIYLPQFMFSVFDVFGIQQDDKADNAIALNPSEHMLSNNFPCLPEGGTTVTFDRDTALSHENYQLLTWDHPMVTGAIELILSDDIGNASIGLLKNPAIPAGTYFLECIFTVEATAPSHLQLPRYLPTTPIRVLVDKSGNNLAQQIAQNVLDGQVSPVKKVVATQLIKALKGLIPPLVTKAEAHAEKEVHHIQQKALTEMSTALNEEHQRLSALAEVNPNVRQEELYFIQDQQKALSHYIEHAQIKFEAVRLIVASQ